MHWRNNRIRYGWISIVMHWLMAIAIVGMYFLGEFIVDIDYYNPWYHTAPDIHRGTGVILGVLLVFRFGWRLANTEPAMEGRRWEKNIARIVHWALYALILSIVISGYLITTADGQPVSFFGIFDIPATLSGIEHQEDIAGEIHALLAFSVLLVAGLHGAAALKHHFINRDRTLLKMLGR